MRKTNYFPCDLLAAGEIHGRREWDSAVADHLTARQVLGGCVNGSRLVVVNLVTGRDRLPQFRVTLRKQPGLAAEITLQVYQVCINVRYCSSPHQTEFVAALIFVFIAKRAKYIVQDADGSTQATHVRLGINIEMVETHDVATLLH